MNDFYYLAWRGHKGEKDDKQSLYSSVWVLFCVNREMFNQKDINNVHRYEYLISHDVGKKKKKENQDKQDRRPQ